MRFTPADIIKLSQLAKLRLSDQETADLASDLEQILLYVDQLKSAPTATPAPVIKNPLWRADSIQPATPDVITLLRRNFPASERDFLRFKKIHKHE